MTNNQHGVRSLENRASSLSPRSRSHSFLNLEVKARLFRVLIRLQRGSTASHSSTSHMNSVHSPGSDHTDHKHIKRNHITRPPQRGYFTPQYRRKSQHPAEEAGPPHSAQGVSVGTPMDHGLWWSPKIYFEAYNLPKDNISEKRNKTTCHKYTVWVVLLTWKVKMLWLSFSSHRKREYFRSHSPRKIE